MVKAFEKILKQNRKPIQLQTDLGREFYNKTFQWFLRKEAIYHFSTQRNAKASIVERFNRTLKERMYRYFTAANTLRYEDVLQSLVRGYNASRHRSIGMAPKDVTWKNKRAVWKRLYGKLSQGKTRPRFKVDDRRRLNEKHRTFKKGYLPGWTEEVFAGHRVVRGVVPTYKIRQLDGTPVEGTFYEQDSRLNLSKLSNNLVHDVLMVMDFVFKTADDTELQSNAYVRGRSLQNDNSIVDGIHFLRAVVNRLEQERVLKRHHLSWPQARKRIHYVSMGHKGGRDAIIDRQQPR